MVLGSWPEKKKNIFFSKGPPPGPPKNDKSAIWEIPKIKKIYFLKKYFTE